MHSYFQSLISFSYVSPATVSCLFETKMLLSNAKYYKNVIILLLALE